MTNRMLPYLTQTDSPANKFADVVVHRSVEETLFSGPHGHHFLYTAELLNTITPGDKIEDPTVFLAIRVYDAREGDTTAFNVRVRNDGVDALIELLRRVADRARAEGVIPE